MESNWTPLFVRFPNVQTNWVGLFVNQAALFFVVFAFVSMGKRPVMQRNEGAKEASGRGLMINSNHPSIVLLKGRTGSIIGVRATHNSIHSLSIKQKNPQRNTH